MSGYVDLHCHFIAQIDDGCRSSVESVHLLKNLKALGFDHVVGTPHMRPGMFENAHTDLRRAFLGTLAALEETLSAAERPAVSLGSEHFFDVQVIQAIHEGRGLPYAPDEKVEPEGCRTEGAILVEFFDLTPLAIVQAQLVRLQTAGYLPVIAHPERYREVWNRPDLVSQLQDAGCVALLDSAALVGKYGRRAEECAKHLLEEGVYHAACSDAHRPGDTEAVAEAMRWIRAMYGEEELELLFAQGPRRLLQGLRPVSL